MKEPDIGMALTVFFYDQNTYGNMGLMLKDLGINTQNQTDYNI